MTLLQRVNGNWASCIEQLEGKLPADASKLMKDRVQREKQGDDEHYEKGAWTSESFNVVKGNILGVRAEFNPLIKYAEEAVEAQETGEFYLTPEIVDAQGRPYKELLIEIAEKDKRLPLAKRRVADFGKVQTHNVATDSFADDSQIVWLARGQTNARRYGNFLRNKVGLSSVRVYNSEIFDKDFARALWLSGLNYDGRASFVCHQSKLFYGGCSVFEKVLNPERER